MSIDISIKFAKLPNGLEYFYQHWIPAAPRALVVFIHGLGDHTGRYDEFVKRLAAKNFAVALYDQRGHGKSSGRRGHIERFEDLVDDLASFVSFSQMCVPERTPVFLVGTSLGGLVGLNFLVSNTSQVAGMVAISAAIKPTVQMNNFKRWLVHKLVKVAPKFTLKNGIAIEDITNDEEQRAALINDKLFNRGITLKTAVELEKKFELAMGLAYRIHVPMFFATGDGDRICAPEGSMAFVSALASTDKTHKMYRGLSHDLLNETGREQVMNDIEDWLRKKVHSTVSNSKQMGLHRGGRLWENVSPA